MRSISGFRFLVLSAGVEPRADEVCEAASSSGGRRVRYFMRDNEIKYETRVTDSRRGHKTFNFMKNHLRICGDDFSR
jgi:hypothetical protein